MLPIGTSIQPKRTPYMNYILIAANIFIFLVSMHFVIDPATRRRVLDLRPWANLFVLQPDYPSIWQFVTYAFLHGGLMHIIGNMFFLYMFGNNVNDKLGNIGYLCFYLGGAVFSGIGYTLISSNPILGASGAVAAVTGAYLVLFPKTLITVVYWFFFIGTVEIQAMYFIALKLIVWDNILTADPTHGIAYNAHLAGYAFGIFVIMGLLAIGLIEGNFNDLFSMLKQWNRRRQFKDAVSDGYDPYKDTTARKAVAVKVDSSDAAPEDQRIIDIRSQISEAMSSRNPGRAAAIYLDLMTIDSKQILPRQLQLDVANQLMSEGKWQPAADAYRKFLSRYRKYEYVEQVHLMLGLLCARYLNEPQQALEYLKKALENLKDPGQKNMCQQEIQRLETTG